MIQRHIRGFIQRQRFKKILSDLKKDVLTRKISTGISYRDIIRTLRTRIGKIGLTFEQIFKIVETDNDINTDSLA